MTDEIMDQIEKWKLVKGTVRFMISFNSQHIFTVKQNR
mgnify:CR=1 FL=1